MSRFLGFMPHNEIEIEKRFIDIYGVRLLIQAGKTGWTVFYEGGSTDYADIEDTAENNFKAAVQKATEVMGRLTEFGPLIKKDEQPKMEYDFDAVM